MRTRILPSGARRKRAQLISGISGRGHATLSCDSCADARGREELFHGVNLTPIIIRQTIPLSALHGRTLAVDAPGELYQFLALIRLRDGTLLEDGAGHVTSHLAGLFYRTTRLVAEHGLKLAYVFDGKPPLLKSDEIERRRAIRERYAQQYAKALAAGDLARAYSKSTMTSRLSRAMLDDAQLLLELLGIPWLQAPGEAEAQAAFMAEREDVWAAASKDYDCLLFGTPLLVRFLTISGREFLPSKGVSRPIVPELIDRDEMLAFYGITREQLVDLGLLVGTDFNPGIHGIGPKKALRLVQQHGRIEDMPDEIRAQFGPGLQDVRGVYLRPEVTPHYRLEWRAPDEAGLVNFLCANRAFDRGRVLRALERMQGGVDARPDRH